MKIVSTTVGFGLLAAFVSVACDSGEATLPAGMLAMAEAPLEEGVAVGTSGVRYHVCDDDLGLNLGECCGNGVVESSAGEECDDGNDVETDGCSTQCTLAVCGDGIVNAGVESCDDGADNTEEGPCFPDCTAELGYVPAGDFWMGCNPALEPCTKDGEKPQHLVTLSAYHIDETMVTVTEWEACVNAGVCEVPRAHSPQRTYGVAGREDHPVANITWYQAGDYCGWVGKRLCTEAEWEMAAKGGCDRRPGDCASQMPIYPWGNDAPTCEHAVMRDSTTGKTCAGDGGAHGTRPVGTKPLGASPYGVLDMAGQLLEWTQDWYGLYDGAPATDPTGPATGTNKVVRGGNWASSASAVRSSWRNSTHPPTYDIYGATGFRCCRSAD